MVDYITAGVDTIGNSVLFTIALLALPENQACQARLRTELETYADGEGNFPSDTIDKLVYLKVGHLVQIHGTKKIHELHIWSCKLFLRLASRRVSVFTPPLHNWHGS